MEMWQTHPKFPAYEVSDHGRVRRVGGGRGAKVGRVLKTYLNPVSGYRALRLHAKYNRTVHALVLEAFVGPCPNGMEARHLDGDSQNNRLRNLCWGTNAENHSDRKRHGRGNEGSRHGLAKLSEKDIAAIRKRYLPRVVTQEMLASEFGVSRSNISIIVNCRAWTHL